MQCDSHHAIEMQNRNFHLESKICALLFYIFKNILVAIQSNAKTQWVLKLLLAINDFSF